MIAEITITSVQAIAAITALSGAVVLVYRNGVAANNREIARLEKVIADLESEKKSFAKVATEAVEAATSINNFLRAKEGRPPTVPIAPVVTEAGSPSTQKQRDNAELETLKAAVEAIKLATGQPPRPEPERAIEPDAT